MEDERRQHKTLVVQELRQRHSLKILLSIAQLPRATFYYHLKQMKTSDKHETVKEEITAIYHENEADTGIAASQRSYATAICR